MIRRKGTTDATTYSRDVPGNKGNYGWAARFDRTNGYIGITQWANGNVERVLLSPAQVRALVKFAAVSPTPTTDE